MDTLSCTPSPDIIKFVKLPPRLDALEAAEGLVDVAVDMVSVPLAPGEEEDSLGAGVGLLDRPGDGRHVGEDVVVHLGTRGPLQYFNLTDERYPHRQYQNLVAETDLE